jgi:hypothetical protein
MTTISLLRNLDSTLEGALAYFWCFFFTLFYFIFNTRKKLFLNFYKFFLKGCYHIDCTYKCMRQGFPLLIFGRTDMSGHFHPISFSIVSHENREDFTKVYKALKNLAIKLDIEFEPDFIMQDAWDASYLAATQVFENVRVLMCYFHVRFNIYRRRTEVTKSVYNEMSREIKEMHFSMDSVEFKDHMNTFIEKYKNTNKKFLKYFVTEWANGDYILYFICIIKFLLQFKF